ncbi:hypothetical protein J6S55_01200, partial [Candidatus Saccharibacteria bacterium]|nr:hypothetical protein [Candidatus Saccharibacteria bacterium]
AGAVPGAASASMVLFITGKAAKNVNNNKINAEIVPIIRTYRCILIKVSLFVCMTPNMLYLSFFV